MSEKCGNRLETILKVIDLLIGIALIGLGAYRYFEEGVGDPHKFFLSFYYIFFGALLIVSEVPSERVKSCFYLLTFPFGKAMFLLFLSSLTFDFKKPIYLIYTIVYIAVAIAHVVFMLLFYNPEEPKPKSSPRKKSIDNGKQGFGKVELDDNAKAEPVKSESGILARRK